MVIQTWKLREISRRTETALEPDIVVHRRQISLAQAIGVADFGEPERRSWKKTDLLLTEQTQEPLSLIHI